MGRDHLCECQWEKAFERDEKHHEEKVKEVKKVFRNQPVQRINKGLLDTKT